MHLLVLMTCFFVVVAAKQHDWWQTVVFYQIYPRSFMDSNNDGVGDLQGITQKLGHLVDAGIKATWLSPIFKSPMADFGYDISNFRDIHEEFGTIEDLKKLTAEAKKYGIKIILDFVPNHTSDEHEWFQLSANRTKGYEDFYIWDDGSVVNGERQAPNNWLSNFGQTAWTWHEGRQQWYLHQFGVKQPDLNYRNPTVVQEMKDTLVYWLDLGIDGFRVDAVPFLFEDSQLRDEPRSYSASALPGEYDYLLHPYTNNLPEAYDLVYQWKQVLTEYARTHDNVTRVMMTEAYASIKDQVKYYGNETVDGADFTFNFLMITDLNINSTAADFCFTINKWMSYMPIKYTPNWVLGNHDNKRFTSRYGLTRTDGLNMLLMILPGVGVTYYGDEIGMLDGFISWEDTKDPQGLLAGPDRYQLFSRDPERTPFQWDDSKNAGFSNASKTWLNVASTYKELNLAKQKRDPESHYKVYQKLIQLRQLPTWIDGDMKTYAINNVIVVIRSLKNSDTYTLIFNLGDVPESINVFPEQSFEAEIVLRSVGANYQQGDKVNTDTMMLRGSEAYILKTPPLCRDN